MKKYADARRRTKESSIEEGDTVLLRNPRPKGLEPAYYPQVETVVKRKGDMLTSNNGTRDTTRNIQRYKKVNVLNQTNSCSRSSQVVDDLDFDFETETEQVPDEQVPEDQVPDEQVPDGQVPDEQAPEEQVLEGCDTRPRRDRRAPLHLKDYIT